MFSIMPGNLDIQETRAAKFVWIISSKKSSPSYRFTVIFGICGIFKAKHDCVNNSYHGSCSYILLEAGEINEFS